MTPAPGPEMNAQRPGTQQVYYVKRGPSQPPVTLTLLVLNVAVFLTSMIFPDLPYLLGLNVLLAKAEPWRLVTSGFVHFGLLHIGLNMLGLWLLGRPLEMLFGSLRFGVLYALSLLGGSAMVLLLTDPQGDGSASLHGGASGALFGLFGALLVLQAYRLLQAQGLLPVLALNLGFSFLIPGISWQAHIGGLVIGTGVAWSMVRGVRRDVSAKGMWVEVSLIAAIVAAMLVMAWLR